MIVESGVIIFLGMLLLGIKLPRHISLKLLGHPLALDLSVSVLAYIMHYGTFSGVMAAAVAGLMCSGFTSVARYAFGYIKNKQYFKGRIWQLKLREDELK
jgi:NhaP-type Na+/H+ or K+/H+ antiporter